ncbi:MAG: DinB family protein [Acidobacteriota bacterium]
MTASGHDLPPQLLALEAELAEARSRAHRLAAGLPAEDWSRRPAPQRWSIGEQVVHLNLTSRAYLPRLEEALAKAREEGLVGDGPFRRDFLGWVLGRLMEPPVRMRIRTSAPFVPASVEAASETLAEFDRLQDALSGLVRRFAGVALDRVDVASPFDARLRYNIYSSLRILTAHQRRHLWLAERIRMELAEASALEVAI